MKEKYEDSRLTLNELIERAKNKEQFYLELKNASFVVEDHPKKGKGNLNQRLRNMLSKSPEHRYQVLFENKIWFVRSSFLNAA